MSDRIGSISPSTPPATLVDDAAYQSIESVANGEGDVFDAELSAKSPYTDTEIVSLDVGPKQTRYRVHRGILAQSSPLDKKRRFQMLWGEKANDKIALPELDEMTAHTLVHFLYTGSYQTLESRKPEGSRSPLSQYKLSTCAYCAALRYELPGLAALAKQTITSLQDSLTILDMLVVAREQAFPLLPEGETWFAEYLEGAIHAAVTKDADLFTRPGFVDQIEGDRRFRQVVMKAIVNSYAQPSPAATPTREEKEQPPASTLSPVVAVASSEADLHSLSTGEAVLDEITRTVGTTHVAPEPYTDDLDWGSSKTFQSQRMGKQRSAVSAVSAEGPAKVGHARVDSVVGSEVAVSGVNGQKDTVKDKAVVDGKKDAVADKAVVNNGTSKEAEEKAEPAAVNGSSAAAEPNADASVSGAKKNKKKKKKGANAAAVVAS